MTLEGKSFGAVLEKTAMKKLGDREITNTNIACLGRRLKAD